MFIIHGKKIVKRKRGFVAEYCPSCSQVRQFRMLRVALVDHLYFVATGDGQTLGYVAQCETCKRELAIEATDYPNVCKNRKTPLDELITRTNSRLNHPPEAWAGVQERLSAVRAPFLRFNESLRDRFCRGTHFDWKASLSLIVVPMSFFITSWLSEQISYLGQHSFLTGAIGFVASFVWVCIVVAGEPKRFFLKKLLPQILPELRSLNANEAEITELFRRFKEREYQIAKVANPESIVLALSMPERMTEGSAVLRSA